MYDDTRVSHVMFIIFITHMHDLAVYAKAGRHFVYDLSLENSEESYLCF